MADDVFLSGVPNTDIVDTPEKMPVSRSSQLPVRATIRHLCPAASTSERCYKNLRKDTWHDVRIPGNNA